MSAVHFPIGDLEQTHSLCYLSILTLSSLPRIAPNQGGTTGLSSLQKGREAFVLQQHDLSSRRGTHSAKGGSINVSTDARIRANNFFYRGDYQQAIDALTEGISQDPHDASPYNNRGAAHAAVGEYELAIVDYDKAIELAPEEATFFNNRGLVYAAQGDYEAAFADYGHAIELNP